MITFPFHSVKWFCPICRTKKQLFTMMVNGDSLQLLPFSNVPWTILLLYVYKKKKVLFAILNICTKHTANVRNFILPYYENPFSIKMFHAQYVIFSCFQTFASYVEMYPLCTIIHWSTKAFIVSPLTHSNIQHSIWQLFRE